MKAGRVTAGLLAALVLVAATPAFASEAGRSVRPGAVGLSAERLDRVDALLRGYVEDGVVPGVQVMIARRDRIAHFESFGVADVRDGTPVAPDTLWRIYSMSKPITSIAVMMLYEAGAFLLDDPVADHLPEFTDMRLWNDGEPVATDTPITIRHLLTHTAGLSYGFTEDGVDALYRDPARGVRTIATGEGEAPTLSAFSERAAALPLAFEPGTAWNYSIATDILGRLVEVAAGMPLDVFLRERLFDPLGMDDTSFALDPADADRLGTNHRRDPERGTLVAFPDDSIAGLGRWTAPTLFSGGGGLLSTTSDYMRLCRMLLRGGELDGARILSPKTVAFMTRNQLADEVLARGGVFGAGPALGFGLGFAVTLDPVALGDVVHSEGAYYWGGAAGTIFWIDPAEELAAIVMVQRMDAPDRMRDELVAAVNAAIVD